MLVLFVESADLHDPGVIDQNIDIEAHLFQFFGNRGGSMRVEKIPREYMNPRGAGAAQLVGEALESVAAARDQSNMKARAGKGAREFPPDALGSAGNHSYVPSSLGHAPRIASGGRGITPWCKFVAALAPSGRRA